MYSLVKLFMPNVYTTPYGFGCANEMDVGHVRGLHRAAEERCGAIHASHSMPTVHLVSPWDVFYYVSFL